MARLRVVVLVALVTVGLAGCAQGDSGGVSAISDVGGTPSASASATPAGSPPTSKAPAGKPTSNALTCGQLADAEITTDTVKLPDLAIDGSMNLAGGQYNAEDGGSIELQSPCGIGDVTGDASRDAVGVVKVTDGGGGTGRFYDVVVWRNDGGKPHMYTVISLGDRNPVVKITISSKKITIVYLTRAAADPMIALTIKRTAVFTLSGQSMQENESLRKDEPYSP